MATSPSTAVIPASPTGPGRRPKTGRMVWVTLVWGACFVVIGWGLPDAPVLWFAALRALLAGVALVALGGVQHRPLPPDSRSWALIAVFGLVDVTAGLGAMFAGAAGAAKGTAAVLANAQPLLIVLPAWWFYRERPTRATTAALILGFAGLGLVASADGTSSGPWLSLGAAAAAAGGTLLARRLRHVDVLVASGWHLLLGGVVLAAWASATEGMPHIRWSPSFIAALAFLALAGTAATSVAWFTEARRARLDQLTAWTFLVPVVGLGLAAALLGERPTGRTLAGLGAVLVALWLTQRPRRTPAPPANPARRSAPDVAGNTAVPTARPAGPIRTVGDLRVQDVT